MKRDLMETAGLELFAEVGIILFFSAFILVVIGLFFMKKKDADEMGRLPLDEAKKVDDDDTNRSEVTA